MPKLLSTIENQISWMTVIKRRTRPKQSSILQHLRSIKASLARRGKPCMPKEALDQPTPSIINIVLGFIPSPQIPREPLAIVFLNLVPDTFREIGSFGVDDA